MRLELELEETIDEADALADRILRVTVQSIEAGEIEAADAGVAYLAVAVRILALCSPHETIIEILRANADVVERENSGMWSTKIN